jgi:rRNA maturation endonuclease Nob1
MEGLGAYEAAYISTTEGMNRIMEMNTLYVKAVNDAAEMLGVALGLSQGAAKVMILGDSINKLRDIADSLTAVRSVLDQAVKEMK